MEDVDAIAHVARKKLGFSELSSIPQTQLPYICIQAGLPDGSLKKSDRVAGNIDRIISELKIEIIVYGQDNVTPDSTISSLADDIWAALYSDPQQSGLCISTEVKTEIETGIFDPYFVFSIECIVQYIHSTGGI
jgi:hypothetical protein